MNWLLTAIFAAIVLAYLIEGFIWPHRIYHFPFLVGVMTFSFLLPQMPAAANDNFLPEGAYAKTMFMGILCLLMVRLGWSARAPSLAMFRVAFSERRLITVAGLFSAIGALFYWRLSHLPGEVSVGVQMSGVSVIWLFFARLLTYGLAIAVLCFARRPSPIPAAIILFDLVFYLERIVITGKRAEATELAIMMVLPFWFFRRWAPPRAAVAAVLLLGTVGMVSMSEYRSITRASSGAPTLEQLAQIDFEANFRAMLENGGPEIRNAVFRIFTIDRNQEFDYGATHWNRLAWNYVPAQLLGSAFKESLMLQTPDPGRDYNPLTGTTETGLSDSFQSFWYFGAVQFLLLSFGMACIWRSAEDGLASAQIVYTLSVVPAMHAVSHATDWVLSTWVHILIFLVPAFYFCSVTPVRTAGSQLRLPRMGPEFRDIGAR